MNIGGADHNDAPFSATQLNRLINRATVFGGRGNDDGVCAITLSLRFGESG